MTVRNISSLLLILCVLLTGTVFADESGQTQSNVHEFTNGIGIRMVLIPSGEFLMGASDDDLKMIHEKCPNFISDSFRDEQPQHRVRIDKPFYMGATEVTRGQYGEFVKATNYLTDAERDGKGGWGFAGGKLEQKPEYTWKNAGYEQTDDHPVVNVSWNDASAFCEWLSIQEGTHYRLPTEAEWEYACRAGTQTLWESGNDPEDLVRTGNILDESAAPYFKDTVGIVSSQDGVVFTAPSGRKRSNAFGLNDMHGNVLEWCSDGYDEKAYVGRGDGLLPKS